jgi:excisionase family DNA binding protein
MKTKLYTYKEASAYLKVSEATLRTWRRDGILAGRTIGPRLVRFTEDELDELVSGDPQKNQNRRLHGTE